MTTMMSHSPFMMMLMNSLIKLPTPSNINYMWNMGSLLGMCLGMQILTGLMVSIHYSSDLSMAFKSVSHIMRDVNNGWLIRSMHANGASLFFIFMYLHIARGFYYQSYYLMLPWIIGTTLLLMTMATAFFGYILPWGQMSFWGATVITNLFSAIPFMGTDIVKWLWGGFAVDKATLTRFYSFHFLLPFLITTMVFMHLLFLHETGSSNPLGCNSNNEKIFFNPYYTMKDFLGLLFVITMFMLLIFYSPWIMGDPENFIPANPLMTPIHIQPEWYFLFAYAILRSIPNKLGGVVSLVLSIMILYIMPMNSKNTFKGYKFNFMFKSMTWFMYNIVIVLTWIGSRPVDTPFITIGIIFTVLYFIWFLMHFMWN